LRRSWLMALCRDTVCVAVLIACCIAASAVQGEETETLRQESAVSEPASLAEDDATVVPDGTPLLERPVERIEALRSRSTAAVDRRLQQLEEAIKSLQQQVDEIRKELKPEDSPASTRQSERGF